MDVQTWAGFALASMVLLVIPGPTVLLVTSYALGQGLRAALPLALGVALGDLTAMTLSLLGLGAVLAASATLFTLLKWAGAAYLVWLGIGLWGAGGALRAEARTDRAGAVRMIGHAWIVTALNPKGITFFVAFLPQFLDPGRPFWPQLLIFQATFLTLATVNALAWGATAARMGRVAASPRTIRLVNLAGGTCLVGAGLWTATRAA